MGDGSADLGTVRSPMGDGGAGVAAWQWALWALRALQALRARLMTMLGSKTGRIPPGARLGTDGKGRAFDQGRESMEH